MTDPKKTAKPLEPAAQLRVAKAEIERFFLTPEPTLALAAECLDRIRHAMAWTPPAAPQTDETPDA